MPANITLNDAFKRFTLDQDKILTPEETIKRFGERLEKVDLDILDKAMRIDNGRLDIPIYFSVCGPDASAITGTKKQMGKGATPSQAEASAVMELAERFSFFSFTKNTQNFFIDTYRNVKSKAIPFELIAKSVHDESTDIGISEKIFEDLPLKWTEAFNLTRNEPVLIPFNWFFAINEFNGPSAGNCTEEAVLQGICEIVERHVCSVVNRKQIRVPGIDPYTATDSLVVDMLQKYGREGIQLFLSDFSLNMGIPTVGVLAYDPATFPQKSEIVWTAGTTPDPQKALSRALTETAQLAGDFNSSANYVASGLPKFSDLKEAEFITRPQKTASITSLPDISDPNIKVEIQNAVAQLEQNDFEVILVDVQHDRLQIPAFYTIIPGAHFRERALNTGVAMFSSKISSESQTPQKALVDLQKMDDMLPGKYFIRFYMGRCHLSLDEPKTALMHMQKALDLNPGKEDRVSIYSYMGVCLKDLGQYQDALAVLKQGAAADSQRTDIHNLMGFCYFKQKKHPQAIECFKKVLQLDPTSAIDYANIASNYRDMEQKEKAIRYYEMALELDPSIYFAKANLTKLAPKSAS